MKRASASVHDELVIRADGSSSYRRDVPNRVQAVRRVAAKPPPPPAPRRTPPPPAGVSAEVLARGAATMRARGLLEVSAEAYEPGEAYDSDWLPEVHRPVGPVGRVPGFYGGRRVA